MDDSILLSLFTVLLLISLIGLVAWTQTYTRLNHESFSFTKHFPFELFDVLKSYQRPYFQLIYLLISIGWLAFYWLIFPLVNSSWGIPLFIVLMMLLIMVYFLMTIRSIPVERFVFVSSIVHVLIIVLPLIVSIFSWTSPFDRFITVLPWVSSFLSVIALGMLFIPSLKSWSRLQEKKSDKGRSYERPKVFILALYQWFYIVSFYLLNFFILIEIFI